MKIVKEPAKYEISEFYDDFTSEKFDDLPGVTIKLTFNQPSKYGGSIIEIHLRDDNVDYILETIQKRLSQKSKDKIKEDIIKLEENYEKAMQMRDWGYCDFASNCLSLNRVLLGEPMDCDPQETE